MNTVHQQALKRSVQRDYRELIAQACYRHATRMLTATQDAGLGADSRL